MANDPNGLVDLCFVRSPFEADTIVACLQDRGFRAQSMTIASSGVQWEGGIANTPRVQVPRSELAEAQAALKAVKEEAKAINWTEIEAATSAIAAGTMCEQCGELREPNDSGAVCTHCGSAPLKHIQIAGQNPGTGARWRMKYLLYIGLALMVLPGVASLVIAALNAMRR